MKTIKIRVRTVTCPKCGVEMYSRARYDYRTCECGTMVDGGFEYLRYGGPNGFPQPQIRVRYISATKDELYIDWNMSYNRFGIIAKKGAK